MFDEFHFIRPVWLWLLLLIPLLVFLLWRLPQGGSKWKGIIDESLLSHLIVGQGSKPLKWPITILALSWLLAVLAIAGPSWQKLPQASYSNQKPLVLLVDLSPSLLVEDLKPSRLAKMRFKLIDLLKARDKGLTALVVYAGDAHVLAPLSDDSKTLQALVPTLSPAVMPIPGSNIEEAMTLSLNLLKDQGFQGGDILWFTDGVTAQGAENIRQQLAQSSVRLSIIGIGTESGAPIPLAEQGFAKDSAGNIVLAKFDNSELQKLADSFSGVYSDLQIDNRDIEKVKQLSEHIDSQYLKKVEQQGEMDQWEDFGQWLTLLVLLLAALSFRRGLILQIAFLSLIILPVVTPQPAQAMTWQDLWETKDQQGENAYQAKDYNTAADKFSDPQWQATAQYKSENYALAAENFEKQNSASGYFNQGNALAQLGKFEEAIKAYDKSLLLEPGAEDAIANKALIKELLEKQKKDQQSQDQQSQDQQSQDQQSQDQQSQDQQSQDKQSQDQQSQDQQSQDQQSQDQQSQDQQSQDQQSLDQQSLDELKKAQAEKQQQAIQAQKDQSEQKKEEEPESAQAVQLTQAQQQKQQELENWLGQLPEDASRLVRNKFRYEFQKKREAYRKGEWQPIEEQRW